MNIERDKDNYFCHSNNNKILQNFRIQLKLRSERQESSDSDTHTRRLLENLVQSYLTNLVVKRVCMHYAAGGLEVESCMLRCLRDRKSVV